MASLAEEMFAEAALPVLFSQHGQSVIYSTPAGAFAIEAIPTGAYTGQRSAISRVDVETILPLGTDLCDFLVEAADLEANGVDTPARGHEIAWNRGARRETYLVLPPSPDVQCFEREGVSGVLLRIHAKLIATE